MNWTLIGEAVAVIVFMIIVYWFFRTKVFKKPFSWKFWR